VLHVLKLVRGALGAALDDGLVEQNPAEGVRVARNAYGAIGDGSTVLTPAEQQALLGVIPEPEKWLVAVAIGTGLRQGELWSLELADVHLEAPVPYIDVRYGGQNRMPTKSGKPRSVPLVGPALPAMRAWMERLGTWCARINVLAFPTQRGCHRGHKAPRGWKRWLKRAGIQRHVRWHDLRHTCASALVSGQWGRKWSLEEVKAYLGHASVKTTERYAKFAGDALMAAAKEMNNG
jgi:integrase